MTTFLKLNALQRARIIIATVFFLGHSPIVPGTVGTVAGVLIYCASAAYVPFFIYLAITAAVAGIAIWVSGFAEKFYGVKDPPQVVIDEVAGFLVAMLLIPPSPSRIIMGFVIFRILDIMKPPPARRCEKLEGGAGIVIDDIVSGLYTNLLMHLFAVIMRFI